MTSAADRCSSDVAAMLAWTSPAFHTHAMLCWTSTSRSTSARRLSHVMPPNCASCWKKCLCTGATAASPARHLTRICDTCSAAAPPTRKQCQHQGAGMRAPIPHCATLPIATVQSSCNKLQLPFQPAATVPYCCAFRPGGPRSAASRAHGLDL